MNELHGACLIAQSGGPTAVINASVLGAVEAALRQSAMTRVLAAGNGIQGVLEGRIYDLGREDPAELALLAQTPAAALGSCRYLLRDEGDFQTILTVFRRYNIRYFFYNGGNDSMDTCDKISRYLDRAGYPCRVLGIPKTIDNDLALTDHCPGFGSAAKYIATSAMEVCRDTRVYANGSVVVMELMGRHAGWLTGSAGLATYLGCGPDLVYLPEVPFSVERFLGDVDNVCRRTDGKCVVAVSEGVRDEQGGFFTSGGVMAGATDPFGHTQLGGLAASLAQTIKEKLGMKKVRGIEPSLLQRCAAHVAAGRDVEEARLAGRAAVEAAVAGEAGKMVAFRRGTGEYRCETELVPLAQVANAEKVVPRQWINSAGNGVTQEFIDYALPLIQGEAPIVWERGLPRCARLQFVPAEP